MGVILLSQRTVLSSSFARIRNSSMDFDANGTFEPSFFTPQTDWVSFNMKILFCQQIRVRVPRGDSLE
eukprot:gene7361-biopygen14129